MSEHTGQVTASAAEVYEEQLVPAVFAEWAPRLADAAKLRPGHRVVDVACGTGVVAREAFARVRPGGVVVGVDRNAEMLAVARRKAPQIDWREGRAEELPLEAASFDAATCQFGLMYFEDRPRALREMARVLKPGGRAVVATWDVLEHQPAEHAIEKVLARRYGASAADEVRAPFAASDPAELVRLLEGAGLAGIKLTTIDGATRVPSVPVYVESFLRGWTLADKLDDKEIASIVAEVAPLVEPHARRAGAELHLPAPAHVVVGTKA